MRVHEQRKRQHRGLIVEKIAGSEPQWWFAGECHLPILCAINTLRAAHPWGPIHVLSSKDLEFIRANLRGCSDVQSHGRRKRCAEFGGAAAFTDPVASNELSLETEGSRRPVGEIVDGAPPMALNGAPLH